MRTDSTYPIPMQVHVIWHPKSEKLCRPIAEFIYLALNRDPQQPLLPGICIPVFFRSIGADPSDPSSAPRPIAIGDTLLDLRIVLRTSEMVMSDEWMVFLDNCRKEISGRQPKALMVVFDLSKGGLEDEHLAIRLDPGTVNLNERVLQHVLLQCCRLLGGRVDTVNPDLGAAPLKLFLSHTKRDKNGLEIATKVKGFLDGLAVERFFDEVSIQPGDDISPELKAGIADAALICIRTDSYVSSPWCRKELAIAKRQRRPMVVLDALTRHEPRSSPLLSHLSSLRVETGSLDEAALEVVVNFVARESVRFLYANLQLSMLQQAGLVSSSALLLTRPPEARDLAMIKIPPLGTGEPPLIIHPDPRLSAEELADLSGFGFSFVTPTSLWQERLDDLQLGLSVSPGDKTEQNILGLSLHVEDAMRVIARQALAAGATLHYGGTLSPGSLTEALFDMIGAYVREGVKLQPLVNHTPWPWSKEVDTDWLAAHKSKLRVLPCGEPNANHWAATIVQQHSVEQLASTPQGRCALGMSLNEMRRQAIVSTDARVLLGGKPHQFSGFLPGIVEEALLAIRAGSPTYVLGGFGGAAKLVADALSGHYPIHFSVEYQEKMSPGYADMLALYDQHYRQLAPDAIKVDYDALVEEFNQYGVSGLAASNGLSEDENRFLFTTASVDAGLYLIMKGLTTIIAKRTSPT